MTTVIVYSEYRIYSSTDVVLPKGKSEKDIKEINKYFPTFQSELMKVAKTGVIKKKNLSRKISKISKKVKKITK